MLYSTRPTANCWKYANNHMLKLWILSGVDATLKKYVVPKKICISKIIFCIPRFFNDFGGFAGCLSFCGDGFIARAQITMGEDVFCRQLSTSLHPRMSLRERPDDFSAIASTWAGSDQIGAAQAGSHKRKHLWDGIQSHTISKRTHYLFYIPYHYTFNRCGLITNL